MAIPRNIFGQLAEIILEGGARKATKILSDRETIKATRQLFKGKIDKRAKSVTILFTIGTPNYEERKLIKNPNFDRSKILIKWPKK
jgi:hypothetical protein